MNEKKYSHARFMAIRERAARLGLIARDLSRRLREVSELVTEAETIRDYGGRDATDDWTARFTRQAPDSKTQLAIEKRVRDLQVERDRLREAYSVASAQWTAAQALAGRAADFIKDNQLEAHDLPEPEPSPFEPKRVTDGFAQVVTSPGRSTKI